VISGFAIEISSLPTDLSEKWGAFGVIVEKEIYTIKKAVQHALYSLKEKRLNQIITEKQELLKTAAPEENDIILKELVRLVQLKKEVNRLLGRIVIR
ncbi:MAG: hypothetical protein ACXVPQ_05755, partial [Bacteroidia bacterium]